MHHGSGRLDGTTGQPPSTAEELAQLEIGLEQENDPRQTANTGAARRTDGDTTAWALGCAGDPAHRRRRAIGLRRGCWPWRRCAGVNGGRCGDRSGVSESVITCAERCATLLGHRCLQLFILTARPEGDLINTDMGRGQPLRPHHCRCAGSSLPPPGAIGDPRRRNSCVSTTGQCYVRRRAAAANSQLDGRLLALLQGLYLAQQAFCQLALGAFTWCSYRPGSAAGGRWIGNRRPGS